jgi:hypothetical protein
MESLALFVEVFSQAGEAYSWKTVLEPAGGHLELSSSKTTAKIFLLTGTRRAVTRWQVAPGQASISVEGVH